ncbi:hypothetical protein N665_0136s0018 [Sinapis alba]|nr:hypothetical protein N665_0136s0018 [Sinapis alba]
MNEEGTLMTAKVNEETFKEATNEIMVTGELPLCLVENVAWKHFYNKMNLDKHVSRRTSTRDIVKIKKSISDYEYLGGASYMVVTAHYTDACWRLKKFIVGFKHVSDHKGQTVSKVLLDVLADWGIEKILCVNVDNACANSSELRRFHSRFFSTDVNDSVNAVRNVIVYVRGSGNKLISFEQKVESGRMTRGSLHLDVTTRWNYTYLMLSTTLKSRVMFEKMEEENKLYNDYKAIERLGRFLVIFYNSTMVVSASTTVNAYKCYEEIVIIATNLIALSHSTNHELKNKAV